MRGKSSTHLSPSPFQAAVLILVETLWWKPQTLLFISRIPGTQSAQSLTEWTQECSLWIPVCILGMRLVVYEFVPCWSGKQNVEGSGHSLLRPFQVTKCFLLSPVYSQAWLSSLDILSWLYLDVCGMYLSSWYWMTGIKILWDND